MRHSRLTPSPRRYATQVLTLAVAALAPLTIAPIADAAARTHTVKLNSVMFAAQIGSTTTGASVFAGAVVDPRLDHGAIVYNASGTSTVFRVTFQEFFALGSIRGRGSVTLRGGTGGQMTLMGSFKVTGGTGTYHDARGKFTSRGIVNSDGTTMISNKGSFSY
jgi:hypothetical protein